MVARGEGANGTSSMEDWDRMLDELAHALLGMTIVAQQLNARAEELAEQAAVKQLSSRARVVCRGLESQLANLALYGRFRSHLICGAPGDVTWSELAEIALRCLDDAQLLHNKPSQVSCLNGAPRSDRNWLRGDRQLLRCALWNIAENAVSYGFEDSPVEVEVVERKSLPIGIAITSVGLEIDKALQMRLCAPFQRGDRARLCRAGMGLGLHVASEVAKLHHGSIRIETDKTSTRVTLELGGMR